MKGINQMFEVSASDAGKRKDHPYTLTEIGMHMLQLRVQLDRIESKLDRLINALADEEQEDQQHDLDGNLMEEYPKGQSL